MPIESEPYYFAVCDNCGKRAEYHDGEITGWQQKDAVADETTALEWTEKDGKFHCLQCPPLDAGDGGE